jgi:hypothetical protein
MWTLVTDYQWYGVWDYRDSKTTELTQHVQIVTH